MKEEIFLAALCAIGKTLPVCLKHSLEGKSWCHHCTDALSLIQFHNATRWMYAGNVLVSWKYIKFSRGRKTDLFLLWNWNNLLMQVTWKALSTTFWCYRPCRTRQGEAGWTGWGYSHLVWRIFITPCLNQGKSMASGDRQAVHVALWQLSWRNLCYGLCW